AAAGLWYARRDRPAPMDGFLTFANESTDNKDLRLPDGSAVLVSPHSSVRYAARPVGSVDVFLSGKAQFTVTAKPNRPFRVYTRELVTTVLGTRFVVSDGENAKVTVLSGKVSVSRIVAPDSVRTLPAIQVKPNQ